LITNSCKRLTLGTSPRYKLLKLPWDRMVQTYWYVGPWSRGYRSSQSLCVSPVFRGTSVLGQIWRIFNTLGYLGILRGSQDGRFNASSVGWILQICADSCNQTNFAFPQDPGLLKYDIY